VTACTKSEQIDLAAFLVEPRAEEWAAFREHYPACPECSAEMARWSELEGILRRPSQPSHPSEAALLAFETDPGTLPAEEQRSVRLHLDSCAPCRDALAAVRSLDLESALEATAAASVGAETVRKSWLARLLGSLRETLGSLAQPRLATALVAAALLLLAIPVALAIWSALEPNTPAAPRGPGPPSEVVASEEPPLEGSAPEPPLHREPPPAPEEQIARAPSGASPARDEPAPAPEAPVARAPAVGPSERPEPEPAGEPEPAAEIVVAALMPASPLLYAPPQAFADAGPGRFAQGRRSAASASTPLALAPDHVGLTVRASPTLHWFLPARADHRIEFVLAAPDAIDPVFMSTLDAPVKPGFHAVPLGDHGVTLEPGVAYRWSVTLVLDEDQRYRDVIGGGAIARIRPSPTLQAEIEKAEPGAAGHTYAANGLWYDALDFVSQGILETPGEPSLRSRRAELLEQAGLQTAADYDRRAIDAE